MPVGIIPAGGIMLGGIIPGGICGGPPPVPICCIRPTIPPCGDISGIPVPVAGGSIMPRPGRLKLVMDGGIPGAG